jgi:hypothetical protein
MKIKNKTELDNLLKKLVRTWLNLKSFTGEFNIIYPHTSKGSLKIELYYDEKNPKWRVEQLSEELCQLIKKK